MAHIPEQLIKINNNIREAEIILYELKKKTKTENVAEQIEHFESMLNKLNSLKESYIQLSAQYEATNDLKKTLIPHPLQHNDETASGYDNVGESSLSGAGLDFSVKNSFSAFDHLNQLKEERDRLKKELQDRRSNDYENQLTSSLEVDITNGHSQFSPPDSFNDMVSDLQNFTGLDLSFYMSVLDHHIEIGTKMVTMVNGLNLSDNLTQGISLLKEVIQRLTELRERFQCVQNTKETIENQTDIDEDLLQREMDTFNSISNDLKGNFATGVKCFKSAMDIIQSYLDPDSVQANETVSGGIEEMSSFGNRLCGHESTLLQAGDGLSTESKNNNNNSESASEDNNNRSNEDDNNDGGDEDSDDSCREKDQDESMEVGPGMSAADSMNDHGDQDAMHHLRLQTEFEQKEILRLLEEKRIMLKKLADLKRAKDIAKNQVLGLAQSGNMFGDFSHFLNSTQCNDLDDDEDNEDVLPNSSRSDPLSLRTGTIANEIGSLLKMFSDIKTEVDCDDSRQESSPRISMADIQKLSNYSAPSNSLLPEINDKAEELKQKQSQIQKLQEMLNQIKTESISLNESIIRDSNNDFHLDGNNDSEIINSCKPVKGRDSVTFQEPVATFIANEELYENMREVRMRREELRDRSVRNSNSDPRSPSGRVMDSGNAPGAPPAAPVRMPVSSHETASQDRTTVATWGSSSAGGDDYEDHSGHSGQLNSENIRIQSEGTTRSTPMSIGNDERSRVAPIGQSSTFRSKVGLSSSPFVTGTADNARQRSQQHQPIHQNVSLGPVADMSSLKGQIENIASLCRNMAMEQNRLARDIADLKSGSSPRHGSTGPDLVMHHSPWTAIPSSSSSKHMPPSQPLPAHDDNLGHWPGNNAGHIVNSVVRNGPGDAGDTRPVNCHIDPAWDEASLASSTVPQPQRQVAPSSSWYYPPLTGYHNLVHQQNMLLQNHTMFIKLQMSLIASQLEQQRLCSMTLQQQQQQQPQHQHMGLYGPINPGWPTIAANQSYYPSHGPLVQPHLTMLPATAHDPSTLMNCFPQSSYMDLDGGLYPMYPMSDNRGDTPSTINQHTTNLNNGSQWKNSFTGARNMHRN